MTDRAIPVGSLDELAEYFPLGLVRYRSGGREPLGRIVGYCWGLPERPGAPSPPSLVIVTEHGSIGTIYPYEIVVHGGPLPAALTETGDTDA